MTQITTQEFISKSSATLSTSGWDKLKSIRDRDIKKAVAMAVGSIAKFDLTPNSRSKI